MQSIFSINNESILTQLVFDHSLRIQLRSDALDQTDEKKEKDEKSTEQPSTASTPATESRPESEPSQSGAQTPRQEASTSTAASTSETIVEDVVAQPEGGHVQAKTQNIVGKINNLMTSDVDSIGLSYNLLFIRKYTLFTSRLVVRLSLMTRP
jgi:hypothetical protein